MKHVNLFEPYVPVSARNASRGVLDTRWIGQGPKVDEFEKMWEEKFSHDKQALAVGSGTDALHVAYILAGIGPGDEVVAPVFTCTATNLPILYQGAKIVFADIDPKTFNIDPDDVERKMTDKTKAIVCVHFGGRPADLDRLQAIADKWGVPLIEDAAQAHGAKYKGKDIGSISDFTCFSFQAIKTITTCDGGMVTVKDPELAEKGRRIRWFGIDRKLKMADRWAGDITEIGYKYQMTDVAAAMGIEAMKVFDKTMAKHRELYEAYRVGLEGIPGLTFLGDTKDEQSSCWMAVVVVENREALKKKLEEHDIESNPVHYRNDIYSVFGGRVKDCPNMDAMEDKYLVLPKHLNVTKEQVKEICEIIRGGW